MKSRAFLTIFAILTTLIAVLGALLLLSDARERERQAQVGTVTVEEIPAVQLPVPERTEEWFVGDWAGLISGHGQADPEWTDFGMATMDYDAELCCLLRVYPTVSGYEAALGNALWSVTEYGIDGFSMVCTRASYNFGFHPDSSMFYEHFSFEEGQTITFTYSEEVKSTVQGAQVPEKYILFGESFANARKI